MRRAVGIAGALVAAQLVIVGVVLGVERARAPEAPFRWERVDEPAPPLIVEGASTGGGADAAQPADLTGATLVHFWATWCAPCVEELPSLVEAARAEGVSLIAVTDEPWPAVARFFDGDVPEGVVRDPTGDAAGDWRVSGLPDTYAVRDGRIVGRIGGPRDWRTAGAREFLGTLRRR